MSIRLELVYEGGVFRPLQPVALAEHQRVTAVIDAPDAAGEHPRPAPESIRDGERAAALERLLALARPSSFCSVGSYPSRGALHERR